MGFFAAILLDTQVLVWSVAEPKMLSRAVVDAIRKPHFEDGVAISAITLWELASLVARGRIQAYGTVDASVRILIEGAVVRPLTPEIVALAIFFRSTQRAHVPMA